MSITPQPATEPYLAVVTYKRLVHERLLILRVRPDTLPYLRLPGQYTTLGLGNWERELSARSAIAPAENPLPRKIIKRAYSISDPLVDATGAWLANPDADELEFYIALVGPLPTHALQLTPRLFALETGDRLYLGARAHGAFTTAGVSRHDDVLLFGTGTGEAPHNAIVAGLLRSGHQGRIVHVVGVRLKMDLGYLAAHRALERRFSNYLYFPLTTREPENTDPLRPDYVGKQYVQRFIEPEQWKKNVGWEIQPHRTHAFLCGNPVMVGTAKTEKAASQNSAIISPPADRPLPSMIDILTQRGFVLDGHGVPGNLHAERYW